MKDIKDLQAEFQRIDGRGYKAYKAVRGAYRCPAFELHIDHVQGDPYAQPSRFRTEIPGPVSGFPGWVLASADRRRAAADFLNRSLVTALAGAESEGGSGRSDEFRILRPNQEVLDRSALTVEPDGRVRARFRVGLPARGRRIRGHEAARLVEELIGALEEGLLFRSLNGEDLRRHVETVEDAVALRSQLAGKGLVAFVAEGARLPRRSGIDPGPLEDGVVPFAPPERLAVELETPNSGRIRGMGVPEGVTLIVGGGYHGKSTLLRAFELGVYDHVPGDGRERVVAVDTAVKIRAEDGRRVAGTDISGFIGRLPGGEDTTRFTTDNASGSTSQAAAIVEALEVGATALLLDEDTSATNFMIRDARMQRLIDAQHEPITPFIDRARTLFDDKGISTILVVGGSGDYFDVADTVIAMREYRPEEVTAEARRVADALPSRRLTEADPWSPPRARHPLPHSIDARRGRKVVSIRVRGRDRADFGTTTVELGGLEQIVETAQVRAIAHALIWSRDHELDGHQPLGPAAIDAVRRIQSGDLADVHPYAIGEMAAFRPFELAAFLNRLRTLETTAGTTP